MNDNDQLIQHPEEIPGYTYGSDLAARSPFTKSVMLHVTVWSRAYVNGQTW